MDILYKLILYIHVSSTILAIGPFFVLFRILRKMKQASFNIQLAYIDIFTFTIQLVKHAGHVLVISGVLLTIYSYWSWTTSWIIATFIVMIGSIFFLARAFSPLLKRFNDPTENKEYLINKLNQSLWIYILLLMLILWLMVTKPVLW